jgi:hypothetical protein
LPKFSQSSGKFTAPRYEVEDESSFDPKDDTKSKNSIIHIYFDTKYGYFPGKSTQNRLQQKNSSRKVDLQFSNVWDPAGNPDMDHIYYTYNASQDGGVSHDVRLHYLIATFLSSKRRNRGWRRQ